MRGAFTRLATWDNAMATSDSFLQQLSEAWPPQAWSDVTVLVAVSGGPDSVALLCGMRALKTAGPGRLVAGHFNHRLRGEASGADETFVVELCGRLALPCDVGRAESPAVEDEPRDDAEAKTRALRYGFLAAAAARWGARYVVTAHTADDQAETILHRILRGTGIAGLAGIPRVRRLSGASTLIRPLLAVRRETLRAYLHTLGQSFRVDASNLEMRFTRNRIRRLLSELAQEFNPAVVDALHRLGRLAGEVQNVVDALVAELLARAVEFSSPTEARIAVESLAGQPRYLVRQLLTVLWRDCGWPLQAMGFEQWDELAGMTLRSDPSPSTSVKVTMPGNILVERHPGQLRLTCAAR